MNTKNKIKIIKRAMTAGEPEVTADAPQKNVNIPQSTRKVVTAWVREFKQRRVDDPKRAFASLFVESAPPLGSLS